MDYYPFTKGYQTPGELPFRILWKTFNRYRKDFYNRLLVMDKAEKVLGADYSCPYPSCIDLTIRVKITDYEFQRIFDEYRRLKIFFQAYELIKVKLISDIESIINVSRGFDKRGDFEETKSLIRNRLKALLYISKAIHDPEYDIADVRAFYGTVVLDRFQSWDAEILGSCKVSNNEFSIYVSSWYRYVNKEMIRKETFLSESV